VHLATTDRLNMSMKILCVDDDGNILAAHQRNLRKQFTIDVALGGEQALVQIESQGPYAVVVADMQMPGMNGVELLKAVRKKAPDTVRMMLTGNADQKTAIDAVNQGNVFQFLTKPCSPEQLASALEAGISHYRLITAERELLEKTLNGSVKMLTDMLSMLDPQSFGSAQRLRDYVRAFGQSRNAAQTWELELAAMLCPIGWLTVPAAVLEKVRAGRGLSGKEKDMVARVPEIGSSLLVNIPRLESVARIVHYQNKNFDGSGFPLDGLAGEGIPIGARVLRALWDLLLMESPKVSKFEALEKMKQCTGRYDPKVLEAVAACFDIYLGGEISNEAPARVITFKDLHIGHILKADLTTADGTLIVPAGTGISQTVMQKLRNFAELSGIKEPLHVESAPPPAETRAAA